jgi:nicotinamide-nucleotide amidase
MFPSQLMTTAETLLEKLRRAELTLATAESCTGGLIAGLLTEIPGSSDVVERGYVTYSNAAKCEALGVPATLIAEHGAVSPEVARAMAQGALKHARADIAVAVTGVAGPGGGSDDKPVGLVHLAVARRGFVAVQKVERFGDLGRTGVRLATIEAALAMVDAMASRSD